MPAVCRMALFALLVVSIQAATEQAFVIRRPTVVAFLPPVDQKQLEHDIDLVAALDDFEYYAGKVRSEFLKLSIDFKQVRATSFRITVSGKTSTFRPSAPIGYYLIAPGRPPRIEYGVHTDADLLDSAKRYFGRGQR